MSAACTKPNPLSCADGNCSDPAHPFCDADGSLEGIPDTCIAVTCSPGSFERCSGVEMLRCNSLGNNYEATQCEHGCVAEAEGCVACIDSTQCANPLPTCDSTSHTCRACTSHSECASEVCDVGSGTCVDPSTIIYVAPDGSPAGDCGAQTAPCSYSRAFSRVDSTHRTIKLRAGTYTVETPITRTLAAGETLAVIGGAVELNTTFYDPAFTMTGAGRFRISGLKFGIAPGSMYASGSGVRCGEFTSSVMTEVEADDLEFERGSGHISIFACNMVITRSRFLTRDSTMISTNRSGSLMIDRSLFSSSDYTHPSIPVMTVDVRETIGARVLITNSVFKNMRDIQLQQGAVDIQFCTFIDNTEPLDCKYDNIPNSNHGLRHITNSIFINTHSKDIATPASVCAIRYSLFAPQLNPPPNSSYSIVIPSLQTMDPKLKDLANGDYHVLPTSVAVDAADPAADLDHDFDGNPRPEGARRDLGAYEFTP